MKKNVNWKSAVLDLNKSIRDAAENLSHSSLRIVLIQDDFGKLVATISDGDIRRGLLKGLSLDCSVCEVMHKEPLVVPEGMSLEMIRHLMRVNNLLHIPEVDSEMHIVDLHLWDDIEVKDSLPNTMIIMAGGKGTRLKPYTDECPKPMLLVSGKPMLQHIIENARAEGFANFLISVNYLSNIIVDYFGNGNKLGVNIDYVHEQIPLGTAGALSLIGDSINKPFIVTNGDVITDINYSELLDFHIRNDAAATMAVRVYEWENPYGVVLLDGLNILGIEEKPITQSHINAGVYALSPEVIGNLIINEYCDMPTLFSRIKNDNLKTIAYPMHEPWLDVGRHDDLIKANGSIN